MAHVISNVTRKAVVNWNTFAGEIDADSMAWHVTNPWSQDFPFILFCCLSIFLSLLFMHQIMTLRSLIRASSHFRQHDDTHIPWFTHRDQVMNFRIRPWWFPSHVASPTRRPVLHSFHALSSSNTGNATTPPSTLGVERFPHSELGADDPDRSQTEHSSLWRSSRSELRSHSPY